MKSPVKASGPILAVLLGLAISCLAADEARAEKLMVFAAASLKEVIDYAATAFEQETGTAVKVAYAGSGTLAKQIERGAPADVFISANTQWVRYLGGKGFFKEIDAATKIASNQLVLIANASLSGARSIEPEELTLLLDRDRLAIANAESVPAGIYAKQAFEALGIWNKFAGRAAYTNDVRAALTLVATGALAYGVVYGSDARSDPRVEVVHHFDSALHDPIVYVAVPLGSGLEVNNAQEFVGFLLERMMQSKFMDAGFGPSSFGPSSFEPSSFGPASAVTQTE